MTQEQPTKKVWTCKIGYAEELPLPQGDNDSVMRKAVEQAFFDLFSRDNDFCFSGWGGQLNESELAVIEKRRPEVVDTVISGTTDARQWAHSFVHTALTQYLTKEEDHEFYGLIDEDLMLAWFANAIEVGRAAGYKQAQSEVAHDLGG